MLPLQIRFQTDRRQKLDEFGVFADLAQPGNFEIQQMIPFAGAAAANARAGKPDDKCADAGLRATHFHGEIVMPSAQPAQE
jgi:hypothetical protein